MHESAARLTNDMMVFVLHHMTINQCSEEGRMTYYAFLRNKRGDWA